MGKKLDALIRRLEDDVAYTARRAREGCEAGDRDGERFWGGANATAATALGWAKSIRGQS